LEKAEDAFNDAFGKVKDLVTDDGAIGDMASKLTGLLQEQYENIPATFYEMSANDIDGDLATMN